MRFCCSVVPCNLGLRRELPAPVEADWIVRDFRFRTGQTLPKPRLHYLTIGETSGEPILIVHGSSGNSAGFLTDNFAGELFGPGQPLDACNHYMILPDTIGNGKSSKPSDEMRAAFPSHNYEDQVRAEYRLVTERLRIPHLKIVMGLSMGGMHYRVRIHPHQPHSPVATGCFPA